MDKRWFKLKHGLRDCPMVRSMGSSVRGGDTNAAFGCWVAWLDYVEMHSPRSGRVLVGSLEGFGELVIGKGSRRSVCKNVAQWLVNYRDEDGQAVLTYEDGVVQMLRWKERFAATSTERSRKCRAKKKGLPQDSECNDATVASLSNSSSSLSSSEPKIGIGSAPELPDELFSGLKANERDRAAADIREAWAAWYAARVHDHGEPSGASIMSLRLETASKLNDYGPAFVLWAFRSAAAGGYKKPTWNLNAYRAEQGKYTPKQQPKNKPGVVH